MPDNNTPSFRRLLRDAAKTPRAPSVIGRPPINFGDNLALLGTLPDRDVAGIVGCSVATVAARRRDHGIPACRIRTDLIDLSDYDADVMALQGRAAVEAFARSVGVSASTVYRRRRVLDAEDNKDTASDAAFDGTLCDDDCFRQEGHADAK
jgi:hypothetical protein